VAHAYKYTYSSDESSWDEEDIALGEKFADFPLIALDLDTTSLGPLVAFLAGTRDLRLLEDSCLGSKKQGKGSG
jgi:hypothetical protein